VPLVTFKEKNMYLVPKVRSLAELFQKANTDDRYAALIVAGAENLGGGPFKNLEEAKTYLRHSAQDVEYTAEQEGEVLDGEKLVVEEVNFCRSVV
jgi:hypothetical protein